MKRYNVNINGHDTVLQLTDEDAKARGLKASDEVKAETKEAKAPANKQRQAPSNKAAPKADAG